VEREQAEKVTDAQSSLSKVEDTYRAEREVIRAAVGMLTIALNDFVFRCYIAN